MRLLLFLLASAAFALNPKLSIRQYSHTAWTDSAGEPLPAIQAITQTRDGYLCLIGNSTHLRFDGLRFSPWLAARGHRMPSGAIHAVTVAHDGAVWFAGAAGLSSVRNGQ